MSMLCSGDSREYTWIEYGEGKVIRNEGKRIW